MGDCLSKETAVNRHLQEGQAQNFQYRVAVICGSIRKASTNAGLVKAVYQAKDTRFFFEWVDISQFPVFNEDIQAQGNPSDVQKARQIVGRADAVLFAVPQYNFTIASPLKNAYDWLSRDDKNKYCPVTGKIGAMISSAAATGGMKAQDHMRQSVEYRKMNLLKPSKDGQIMIRRFNGNFFDEQGNLIDMQTRKRIQVFLNEFYNHIKANKKP